MFRMLITVAVISMFVGNINTALQRMADAATEQARIEIAQR